MTQHRIVPDSDLWLIWAILCIDHSTIFRHSHSLGGYAFPWLQRIALIWLRETRFVVWRSQVRLWANSAFLETLGRGRSTGLDADLGLAELHIIWMVTGCSEVFTLTSYASQLLHILRMVDWGQGVRLWTAWWLPIHRVTTQECSFGAIPVDHGAGTLLPLRTKVCHAAVALVSMMILVVAGSQVGGWVCWRRLSHSHHILSSFLCVNVTVDWGWPNHVHILQLSGLNRLKPLWSTTSAREPLRLRSFLQLWCLVRALRRPTFACHQPARAALSLTLHLVASCSLLSQKYI